MEPRQEHGDRIRHKDTAALEILTRFGPAWIPSDFPGFTSRRVYQFPRTCGPKERVPRRKRYPQRTQSPTGSTQAIPIVLRNGIIRRVQEHKICSFQSLYRGVPVCLSKKELDVSRHTNIRRRRVLCRDTVRVIEQDLFRHAQISGRGDRRPVPNRPGTAGGRAMFPSWIRSERHIQRASRHRFSIRRIRSSVGKSVPPSDSRRTETSWNEWPLRLPMRPAHHASRRRPDCPPCENGRSPSAPLLRYPPGRCSSRTARNSLVGLQAGHSSVAASRAPRW